MNEMAGIIAARSGRTDPCMFGHLIVNAGSLTVQLGVQPYGDEL